MKTSRISSPTRASVVSILGLAAFIVAVPEASAQDVVHACVQRGSGLVYVVDEAGACKTPHAPLELSTPEASAEAAEVVTEPLELKNGWQAFEGDFETPTASRQGNVVVVEGLIKSGKKFVPAAQLPDGWAPAKRLLFPSYSKGGWATRVDVFEDGSIRVLRGNSAWVTLSGLVFIVGEDEN